MRDGADTPPEIMVDPAERARGFTERSEAAHSEGRLDDAVAASARAVAFHRGRAADQPDTSLPLLAENPGDHAADLRASGRTDAAITARTESDGRWSAT